MPTPMEEYAKIAAEYGVDANDPEAVDEFFEHRVNDLPESKRVEIFERLLGADGPSEKPVR